jgi:hypothetical protein
MAGKQDFWEFFDDFIYGGGTVPATAGIITPWKITDTSSGGTPTYVFGVDQGTSGSGCGEAKLTFDNTSEIQNVCLSFGDALTFDVNDGLVFEARVKMAQSTLDSATSLAFGITGDRADAIDSVAYHALFRLIGSDSVVCESDDGVTDKDDIATGLSLVNAYKLFKIDAQNLSNVKFYMSDAYGRLMRVAASTTFDLSAYSGSMQPFFQLQKTADTNTDSVLIDYVRVTGRRRT